MLNDLAEAMKALDGKKSWLLMCCGKVARSFGKSQLPLLDPPFNNLLLSLSSRHVDSVAQCNSQKHWRCRIVAAGLPVALYGKGD